MRRHSLRTACVLSITLSLSCTRQDESPQAQASPPAQPAPRTAPATENNPIVGRKPETPLPKERAEAFFKLEMAGDQMTTNLNTRPSRLLLVLRHGATEQQVEISRCKEFALGNAMGGGTETVLELAGCGGLFSLETDAGFVTVNELGKHNSVKRQVLRLPLPPGIPRAVSPPSHE